MNEEPLLSVENLTISFQNETDQHRVVTNLNLHLKKGECLALVGESGCGKSVTALSILGLLPYPSARIEEGKINYAGINLVEADTLSLSKIRGRRIAMIFQEPLSSLNPVLTIGEQIGEKLRTHFPTKSRAEIQEETVELLAQVQIAEPRRRLKDYPHQLSGGLRQRVMIAIALACGPEILLADEPTTALDVSIQAQILKLLEKLRAERQMSMIFITHDLGVVSEISDRVAVMYAGQIVEEGAAQSVFAKPAHPYTKRLFASIPHLHLTPKTPLQTIEGHIPQNMAWGVKGCRFAARCPEKFAACEEQVIEVKNVGSGHLSRCLK